MSTLLATLRSLVVDNPIVAKDASLVLRRRRTVAIWAVAAVAVAVASAMVVVETTSSLRWYGTFNPAGDDLLLLVCGVTFGMVSILVPALASSSIAGEREQGTLPLLLVTGLSPLQIVVGKLLAVLVIVAPFVALALPPMGFASILLGVSAADIGLAVAGIVATTVAAAAVGVCVSALTTRARAAAPGALLAAGLPAVLCALPSFVAVASLESTNDFAPVGIGALATAAAVTVVAVYLAWSALAPKLAHRFAPSAAIYLGITIVLPLIAHALVRSSATDEVQGAVVVPVLLILVASMHLFASFTASDARAPAPALVVPVAAALTGIGALLTLSGLPNFDEFASRGMGHAEDIEAMVLAGLNVFAAASLAALVARARPNPVLAAVVGAAVVLGILMVPVAFHEVGIDAFGFLNFAYIRRSNAAAGIGLWSVLSVVALALASVRRRRG